jgi:hypothetical protein
VRFPSLSRTRDETKLFDVADAEMGADMMKSARAMSIIENANFLINLIT